MILYENKMKLKPISGSCGGRLEVATVLLLNKDKNMTVTAEYVTVVSVKHDLISIDQLLACVRGGGVYKRVLFFLEYFTGF